MQNLYQYLDLLKDFFSLYILTLIRFRLSVFLTVNRLQKLPGFCCRSSRDFWSNGFIVAACKQVYCSSDTLPPTALFLTPADPLQPGCVSLKLVTAGEGRWLKRRAFVFAPLLLFSPLFPLSARLCDPIGPRQPSQLLC